MQSPAVVHTCTHLLYKVGAVKSHQHAGTGCTCVACKALWDMFSDPWQNEGLSGVGVTAGKGAADKEFLCVVRMCASDCGFTQGKSSLRSCCN